MPTLLFFSLDIKVEGSRVSINLMYLTERLYHFCLIFLSSSEYEELQYLKLLKSLESLFDLVFFSTLLFITPVAERSEELSRSRSSISDSEARDVRPSVHIILKGFSTILQQNCSDFRTFYVANELTILLYSVDVKFEESSVSTDLMFLTE